MRKTAHTRDAARDVRVDMAQIDSATADRLLKDYLPIVVSMARAYSVEREELLTVGKIAIMEAFCTYDQATAKGSERTWVRKTIRWRLNGASWREKSASDPEIFVRDEAKTNGRHDPEKANLKSEIIAALERLPPRQRTILDGRLRGETYQEIAGTLGISHQRVQQEAQTAYTALREWIES